MSDLVLGDAVAGLRDRGSVVSAVQGVRFGAAHVAARRGCTQRLQARGEEQRA